MLHCVVLCCVALCCAVLYCVVLCCTVLCCAVLCCTVLCCAVYDQVTTLSTVTELYYPDLIQLLLHCACVFKGILYIIPEKVRKNEGTGILLPIEEPSARGCKP